MQIREKKVAYKVRRSSAPVGRRTHTIIPALDISGAWFQAAGFQPGDGVTIEVSAGQLIVRKR